MGDISYISSLWKQSLCPRLVKYEKSRSSEQRKTWQFDSKVTVLIRLNFICHILLFTWTVMLEWVIIYYFYSLIFWLAHQQSVAIHSSSIAFMKQQTPPPPLCQLFRFGSEWWVMSLQRVLAPGQMKCSPAATRLRMNHRILRQTLSIVWFLGNLRACQLPLD